MTNETPPSDNDEAPTVEPSSSEGLSRRSLLDILAKSALGHASILFFADAANAAPGDPQQGYDCAIQIPGTSVFAQDLDCGALNETPQGYEKDESCGKPSAWVPNEVYADSSCAGTHATTGFVETDEDCGLRGSASGTWMDNDCSNYQNTGDLLKDNDCETIPGEGPSPSGDSDCGLNVNSSGSQYASDADCARNVPESDADCGLPSDWGIGNHHDADCGPQSGTVSQDSDCELPKPYNPGTNHSDNNNP